MNKEVIILSIHDADEQLIESIAYTLNKVKPEYHWIIISKKLESIPLEVLRNLVENEENKTYFDS